MYDVAVIGAGISGASVARELARYDLKIVILEKTNDVSNGTTKANSAIIHAGYDAPYGSKKARYNVIGNQMYGEICEELSVPFERIGSLVVAYDEEDCEELERLYENGKKLEIEGLEIIGRERVKTLEPNLSDEVVAALYAPTAGIVESWEMAIAYAENAIDNGVELKLNYAVETIEKSVNGFVINAGSDHVVEAKVVVNAAGVYAADVYALVTESDFTITPRRGEYYLLDKTAHGIVNHVIFQTPTKKGKGVLMAPTVDHNVIIGPNAEDLDQDQKGAVNTTVDGLAFVLESAKRISEHIPFGKTITTFAGLRAEPSCNDFVIGESDRVPGFFNIAGIKSPGLSAAPAVAVDLAEEIAGILGDVTPNQGFDPIRRPRVRFHEASEEVKQSLIGENPQYANVICRCETITEAEIVDAIHRSAGGRTLNGIKRRCRPGAGRCQGGFCGPRVLEILARELEVTPEEIMQENAGSYILTGETKETI